MTNNYTKDLFTHHKEMKTAQLPRKQKSNCLAFASVGAGPIAPDKERLTVFLKNKILSYATSPIETHIQNYSNFYLII